MNFELNTAGVSLALQLGKVALRLGLTPLVNACPLTLIKRAAATWEVLVEKDGFAVGDHRGLPVALCQSFCQQCDQVLFIWPQGRVKLSLKNGRVWGLHLQCSYRQRVLI